MRVQNMACGVPVKSQQMKFRINALIACILAEIAVILRIYSKVKILGKLGPDDYCIMIAAVSLDRGDIKSPRLTKHAVCDSAIYLARL